MIIQHSRTTLSPQQHMKMELASEGIASLEEYKHAESILRDVSSAIRSAVLLVRYADFLKAMRLQEIDGGEVGEDDPISVTYEVFAQASLEEQLRYMKNYAYTHLDVILTWVLEMGGRTRMYLLKRLEFYKKLVRRLEETGELEGYASIKSGLVKDMYRALLENHPVGHMLSKGYALAKQSEDRTGMHHFPGFSPQRHHFATAQTLIDTYNAADQRVQKRYPSMDKHQVRHCATTLGATWLHTSMGYNDPSRSVGSSYTSTMEEQILWARLGSDVRYQCKTLRDRMGQGGDMDFVGWYKKIIGLSGDNKFVREKKLLLRDNRILKGEATEADRDKGRTPEQILEYTKYYHRRRLAKQYGYHPEEHTHREGAEEYASAVVANDALSVEEVITYNEERIEYLTTKAERSKGLVHKALDLHYAFRSSTCIPPYFWIEQGRHGLVNTAHRMLRAGVPQEDILSYTVLRVVFSDLAVDRTMLEGAKGVLPAHYTLQGILAGKELLERTSYAQELEMQDALEQLRILSHMKTGVDLYNEYHGRISYDFLSSVDMLYEEYYQAGIPLAELQKWEWVTRDCMFLQTHLQEEYHKYFHEFPEGGKNKMQLIRWLTKKALTVPEGWSELTVGKIMLNRLQLGRENTIHDTSQLFAHFSTPDTSERYGPLRDTEKEEALLHSLLHVDEVNRRKLPTKLSKVAYLFSSPERMKAYYVLLSIMDEGDLKRALIDVIAEMPVGGLETQAVLEPTIKKEQTRISMREVQRILEVILKSIDRPVDRVAATKEAFTTIGTLGALGIRREHYQMEAQQWLMQHGDTEQQLLIRSWQNREVALRHGVRDNPRAIDTWGKQQTLLPEWQRLYDQKSIRVSWEDIVASQEFLEEMTRCYGTDLTLKSFDRLRSIHNPHTCFPPIKIDLGEGVVGEVFAKNDPRGTTIGHDTGCCMTLGGVSANCIQAGYEHPEYGFFGLYRDGELVAQSLLYTNPRAYAHVLVVDNIEASRGRSMAHIRSYYQQFFTQYLALCQQRATEEHPWHMDTVHVGIGESSVALTGLPFATSVPGTQPVYTDATTQKQLVHLHPQEGYHIRAIDGPSTQEVLGEMENILERYVRSGVLTTMDRMVSQLEAGKRLIVVTRADHCVVLLWDERDGIVMVDQILCGGKGPFQGAIREGLFELERRGVREIVVPSALLRTYPFLHREYMVQEASSVANHATLRFSGFFDMHSLWKQEVAVQTTVSKKKYIVMESMSHAMAKDICALEVLVYPEELQNEDDLKEEIARSMSHDMGFVVRDQHHSMMGYILGYPEEVDGEQYLYISDIVVHPDAQRQGVGTKLLGQLLQRNTALLPVMFEARERTSYRALQAIDLGQLGYRIDSEHPLEGYYGEEGAVRVVLMPL